MSWNSSASLWNPIFLRVWIAGLCSLAGVSYADDWTTGRGNAQATGATKSELPSDLELLWEIRFEGLGFDAGPIIADGKVFANDHDGRVLALDLQTGKEIWKVKLDTGFVATPSYDDDTLYVGDYDGVLHALNAADGQEKWQYETGMEITASPNFYEDSVVFTSQDGTLYRLKKTSGELVWKYETEEPIMCGAALAGDRTFLGGCDERLHVVDLKSGKAIGEPVTIGPTASTPAFYDNKIIIPTHAGDIFAFEVPSNAEAWHFLDKKLSDEFKNSVAVADGLAVATGRNKRVFAVEIASGKVKWSQVLRKRADASPIIAGNSVIVAAADGRILRYDLQTGKEQWMFEVKGAFLGPPAVADGKLVLTNDRGTIFCFGSKDVAKS